MWSHIKLGSILFSLSLSGCALPEGGGQASVVEKSILPNTGGAAAQSTEPAPQEASGGSFTTGGASDSGSGSSSGGGVSSNSNATGGCSSTSDAGFDTTCLCVEGGRGNAILSHGSAILSQLEADNRGDPCASSFLYTVSSGEVMGVASYFDEGDRILSLGAVTSLFGIRPVSFKLAIYTSDANGAPASSLFITPDIIATESTTDPPPEYKLPSCVRIGSSGTYWLMMLPNGETNIDCVKVYTDNRTIPDGNFHYANHANTFQPEANWLPGFVPYVPCKKGLPYLGAYPHLFARLISGRP